ncbi:MAG TPA: hypothetical protein VIY47_09580 [Ignavibacteriaceae bacterium]
MLGPRSVEEIEVSKQPDTQSSREATHQVYQARRIGHAIKRG